MIVQLKDGTVVNVTGAHEITREQIVQKLADLKVEQDGIATQVAALEEDLADFDRLNPPTEAA